MKHPPSSNDTMPPRTALPFERTRSVTRTKLPSRRAELKRLMLECHARDVSVPGRLVCSALWSYAGHETGLAWPGSETLQRYTGLSASGARKALRELEAASLVRSVRAAKDGERIRVGNTTLNRSSALYLLWPVATAAGKAIFAYWYSPHARVADPSACTWRVRLAGGDATMNTTELLTGLQTGTVSPTTPVQTGTMPWTRAMDVSALASAVAWPLAG